MSTTPSASEQWLVDLTDTAEIAGETVYAAVTLDLDIDSVVVIHRRHAGDERSQGLAIDTDRPFTIADRETSTAVLWSDTAPDTVELIASAGRLTLWNVWRHEGAVHAWIGDAGIRRVDVDDHDSDFALRLLATDGFGSASPTLEVEVQVNAAPRPIPNAE